MTGKTGRAGTELINKLNEIIMGKQIVWYEKGTNIVKQIIYESESDEVDIKQLNNMLLIRDGDRIAKCIFDENADNGNGRYRTAITDLPALPILNFNIKDDYVADRDQLDGQIHVDHASKSRVSQSGLNIRNDDYDITQAMNTLREYQYAFPSIFSTDFITNLSLKPEDTEKFKNAIKGKYLLLTSKKPKYYAGYVFISYAFELFDGSITKPSPPQMFLLGDPYYKDLVWFQYLNYDDDNLEGSGFSYRAHIRTSVRTTPESPNNPGYNIFENYLNVSQIAVSIREADIMSYDKDIIKSVVVYCSKPVPVYDFDNFEIEYLHFVIGTTDIGGSTDDEPVINTHTFLLRDDEAAHNSLIEGKYNLCMSTNFEKEGVVKLKLTENVVNSIILYRTEKFISGEKSNLNRILDLSSIQANENMQADASGWWDTSGEMFVYNQRLHLFNYKQNFKLDANNIIARTWLLQDTPIMQPPSLISLLSPMTSASYTANVFIKTESDYVNIILQGFLLHYYVHDNIIKIVLPYYIAFPDSRAERIDFYFRYNGKIYRATQNLIPSKIGNVAYSANITEDNTLPVAIILLSRLEMFRSFNYSVLDCVETDSIPAQSNLTYANNTNIIVSELNNPFYFPVSQSYQAGAAIVQLAVSHEEITSSQVGQYPLYVFTEDRIFALGAGSGNVLYANSTPISAEICINKNVLQTKFGILFMAYSGLKLISGREITDISDVIERDVDKDVRRQGNMTDSPYKQALSSGALVDLYGCLSDVVFEDYVKNAVFGYDINNNEAIVSNRDYGYSYVFEFNNRIWHKISEVFEYFSRNTCLMKINNAGKRNVTDIRIESRTNAEVLIQTRPMVLSDYDFKAVRRFAVRGEVTPRSGRFFGFYGLGSNNLKDYGMIAGVQTGNYFGVLTTQKVGKWHRYFVLMCAGEISPESKISHFEAEFEDKINKRLR
jgi:hypothetical protein